MQNGTASDRVQWQPRDNIAIFVRTLHLLDLDLLPDFPSITESTLRVSSKAPSNLQHRVKSIEWALYRLYELYDPDDTRVKLQPYFPPSTPINSLNLRTGLYKALTELKKNGLLPRDVVLRKTMLDECKGEKFEEVLAAFGMLVLRQPKQGRTRQKPAADSITVPQPPQAEQIVPLIIAHRVSLQASLRKRQHLRAQTNAALQELQTQRDDIARRMQILSAQAEQLEDVSPEDGERLQEELTHAFSADRRWAEYILRGRPASTLTDQIVPSTTSTDRIAPSTEKDVDEPMREVLASIYKCEQWTQHLESLRDSLLPVSEVEGTSTATNTAAPAQRHANLVEDATRPATVASRPKPRFDRHQGMTLGNLSPCS